MGIATANGAVALLDNFPPQDATGKAWAVCYACLVSILDGPILGIEHQITFLVLLYRGHAGQEVWSPGAGQGQHG